MITMLGASLSPQVVPRVCYVPQVVPREALIKFQPFDLPI
jgi:hypothetical protein